MMVPGPQILTVLGRRVDSTLGCVQGAGRAWVSADQGVIEGGSVIVLGSQTAATLWVFYQRGMYWRCKGCWI